MNTTTITLARALKTKNRITQRLKDTSKDLQDNNSIIEGGLRKVGAVDSMNNEEMLFEDLVLLKSRIAQANSAVQPAIIEIGELRSRIDRYKKINTDHGIVQPESRYGEKRDAITKSAVYSETDIRERVQSFESRIDALQEQLDTHNHTVTIEVPIRVMSW